MKNIRHNRPVLATLSIVSLIIVGAIAYFAYTNFKEQSGGADTGGVSVEPAPAKLSNEDAQAKQRYIEEQTKQSDTSTSSPSKASPAKIAIAARQDTKSVTVTTQITNIGDGTCTLLVSNESKQYTASANVLYQPTYSTCAGFSVEKSKLGDGVWNITVQVKSLNSTRASASTSLEVRT